MRWIIGFIVFNTDGLGGGRFMRFTTVKGK
jgi:hypothetical protein